MPFINHKKNLNKKVQIAALLLAIVGVSFAFIYALAQSEGENKGENLVCLLEEEAPVGQLIHQLELTSKGLIDNLKLVSYYSRQAIVASKAVYDLSSSAQCTTANCAPGCTTAKLPAPGTPTTPCSPGYSSCTWQNVFRLGSEIDINSHHDCSKLNLSYPNNLISPWNDNAFYARFEWRKPSTNCGTHPCSCGNPDPAQFAWSHTQSGEDMIQNLINDPLNPWSRKKCTNLSDEYTCIQTCTNQALDYDCSGKTCQEWRNTTFDAFQYPVPTLGNWCVREWCACPNACQDLRGTCNVAWPCATVCTPGRCGLATNLYPNPQTGAYACPFAQIDQAANNLKVARNRIVDAVGPRTAAPYSSIQDIFTCKITSLPPVLGDTCRVPVFGDDPKYKTCPATPVIFPQSCSASIGERIMNDLTNATPSERTTSIIADLLKYTRNNLDKCHLLPTELYQEGKKSKFLTQCPEAASLEPMLEKCYPYNQECCTE